MTKTTSSEPASPPPTHRPIGVDVGPRPCRRRGPRPGQAPSRRTLAPLPRRPKRSTCRARSSCGRLTPWGSRRSHVFWSSGADRSQYASSRMAGRRDSFCPVSGGRYSCCIVVFSYVLRSAQRSTREPLITFPCLCFHVPQYGKPHRHSHTGPGRLFRNAAVP
jgi:hypothetical protein